MSMTLVSTVEVGSGGAATIDFTSIPASATDLLVLCSLRANTGANYRQAYIRFNGSSATDYSIKTLNGVSGVADSNSTSGATQIGYHFATASFNTANTINNSSIYIPNYAGATNKSVSVDSTTENNATVAWTNILAGLWSNTSAINQITLSLPGSGIFVEYSTASLYLITKGSGGATTSP